MKLPLLGLAIALAITPICRGEIEKVAVPTDQGFEFHWWPKVGAPQGFVFDQGASYDTGTSMFVQKGSTFSDSVTVIYAKACYKPREPESKTLQTFIEHDIAAFKEHDARLVIALAPEIPDGDGKKLTAYSFTPAKKGNWEFVVYGEEDEYYLVFSISSRTRKGFEQNFPAFKAMVTGYHEKPVADEPVKNVPAQSSIQSSPAGS